MEGTLRKRRTFSLRSRNILCIFSEIFEKLKRKTVYVSLFNITESILREINTRNAYVLRKSRAHVFITILNSIRMRDGPIFRIMKERKCTYTIFGL